MLLLVLTRPVILTRADPLGMDRAEGKEAPASWRGNPAGRGVSIVTVTCTPDAAAVRRGGQAVSFTIVGIAVVPAAAPEIVRGARRLTGLFWQCATRDTRRLVPPGQMSKTGICILSGEPMPGLRLVPAASAPPQPVAGRVGTRAARYTAPPAGTG